MRTNHPTRLIRWTATIVLPAAVLTAGAPATARITGGGIGPHPAAWLRPDVELAATPSAGAARGRLQSAEFSVVIEGTATATHGFTEQGRAGFCNINVSGTITQSMTLQRGKGLRFIAVRKGGKYGLERVGNSTDVTVIARVTWTSQGQVSVTPSDPQFAQYCPPYQADLSKGCPTTKTYQQDFGFEFQGSNFALRPVGDQIAIPGSPCAQDQYTAGMLNMTYGYPDEPEVGFVAFPFSQFFGHKHAFLVTMKSGQITDPPKNTGTPPLLATLNDGGSTSFLLRFIRQG